MNGMLSVAVTLALPRVTNVKITDDTLAVDLEDGRTIFVIPPDDMPEDAQRAIWHWSQ